MNKIKTFLAALAATALASSASAIVFQQEIIGNALKTFNSSSTSAYNSSWQNITNSGTKVQDFLAANPAYYVTKVLVTFGFAEYATGSTSSRRNKDAIDYSSSYKEFAYATVQTKYIDLGGEKNGNGATEVDGVHPIATFDYHTGSVNAADFGGVVDGTVEFRVKSDYGSFYLKTAKIEVHLDKPYTSVPDTGTSLSLLAIALGGLVALRRRFAK